MQKMDIKLHLSNSNNMLLDDDHFQVNDGKSGAKYKIEQVIEMKRPVAINKSSRKK
jgi:hypothetical protein